MQLLMSSSDSKWDTFKDIFSSGIMKKPHGTKSCEYKCTVDVFIFWPKITLPKVIHVKVCCHDAESICPPKNLFLFQWMSCHRHSKTSNKNAWLTVWRNEFIMYNSFDIRRWDYHDFDLWLWHSHFYQSQRLWIFPSEMLTFCYSTILEDSKLIIGQYLYP